MPRVTRKEHDELKAKYRKLEIEKTNGILDMNKVMFELRQKVAAAEAGLERLARREKQIRTIEHILAGRTAEAIRDVLAFNEDHQEPLSREEEE